MATDDGVFAAIEAGGTKFRVAITEGRKVVADTTIPTTTPDETLGASIDFISDSGVEAAGIAWRPVSFISRLYYLAYTGVSSRLHCGPDLDIRRGNVF